MAREALPAPAAQLAEVVQLQHPAGTEDLQAFLRETLVAVREIVDGTDGTIGKLQRNHCLVVSSRQRRMPTQCHRMRAYDWRASQVAQQVDEVATLADDAPAAHCLVLSPVVGRNGARIDGHHEVLRFCHRSQQFA